ncbi:MAG TPA: helix-turn-helix domain-containing protein, partial [Vicinamibacteria bacterium]
MSSLTVTGEGETKKKRNPYHHGALREALLEVAEELLSERGVEGFTLRECARRAGVS